MKRTFAINTRARSNEVNHNYLIYLICSNYKEDETSLSKIIKFAACILQVKKIKNVKTLQNIQRSHTWLLQERLVTMPRVMGVRSGEEELM